MRALGVEREPPVPVRGARTTLRVRVVGADEVQPGSPDAAQPPELGFGLHLEAGRGCGGHVRDRMYLAYQIAAAGEPAADLPRSLRPGLADELEQQGRGREILSPLPSISPPCREPVEAEGREVYLPPFSEGEG